jgi:predicted HAD superfamily Cof-like phosphohydrolase
MSNWAEDQAYFMLAGGQTFNRINQDQMERYKHHIIEEANEIEDAWADGDMLKVLDGAVDTIVVCIGLIRSMGINPNDAWNAVHGANMRKVVDGKVYRRADGQIGKPPGWYGPENELKLMLDRAGFESL